MNKTIIYTSGTCGYCNTLKEELNKNGFGYEEKIKSEFEDEWEKVYNFTGLPTVPTVVYNNEYFVPGRDFQNPQQLINIISSYKKPLHSESKRILEKIKTLNYSVNMAFGRLDQLLRQIETKINKEDEHKSTS